MRLLFILFIMIGLTACDDGGGGTIYTDLCKDHPTNCEIIPEDQQRGGPINNDDDIPPFVEDNSFYTSFEIEQQIALANDGDTILIDKNVEIRNPIIINKPITLMKDPQVSEDIILNVIETSSAFFLAADNVVIKDLEIDLDNSFSLVEANSDFDNNVLASNLTFENVVVKLFGIARADIAANNLTLKNSTFLGLADVRLDDFNMIELRGDGIEISGNVLADVNNNYKGVIFIQGFDNMVVNSNLIKGHASAGLSAVVGMIDVDNVSIENNVMQDSNTGRQNIESDPDDEVNGSAVVGVLQSNDIRDNGKVNTFKSDRFLLSDILIDFQISTNVVFGTQIELSNLFTSGDIFNNDYSLKCDLANNPAIFSANDDNNLTAITGTSSFYAGSTLLAPNCP